MILNAILCLLGLALAALGAYMLLFPARFKRFQWRLNALVRRRLAWTRLAGMAALLAGTVLFVVRLAALLVSALFG